MREIPCLMREIPCLMREIPCLNERNSVFYPQEIIMKNLTIIKSNQLIEASYKLTLEEQRLLLACIAQIKSTKEITNEVIVNVENYADIFNIQKTHAYEQLKTAARNLYQRDIKIFDKEHGIKKHLRWVYKIKYFDKQGRIMLGFSPDIKPYISQLKNQFTSYKLHAISNLKSSYSIRVYELLMQFKSTGKRTITIEKLRLFLEMQNNKYSNFSDIRRWIVEPSIKELNEKTDLIIDWFTTKKGKRVESISFLFKLNFEKNFI